MKQLFVSYSRANQAAVDEFVRRLSSLDYQGWVDAQLRGGQSWWDEILDRIANCDAFVATLSRDSLNSFACQRELAWAVALGKPLLPVAMEPVKSLVQALPRELATRQIIDYSEPGQDAAFALFRALSTLPPAPAPPEVLPERPTPPLSYLNDLAEKVSQDATLTREQQSQIILRLQPGLDSADPEEKEGAQFLLDKFSRRDDLYADAQQMLRLVGVLGRDTHQVATEVHNLKADAVPVQGDQSTSAREDNGSRAKRQLRRALPGGPLISTAAVIGALAVVGAIVLGFHLWPGSGESSKYKVTTIPVGKRPWGVAVNSTTHTIYVTNSGDNNVSVINGDTREVTTVPVGKTPKGVAVNPEDEAVYVSNVYDRTVSVIEATNTVNAPPIQLVNSVAPDSAFRPDGVAVNRETSTIYVVGSTKRPGQPHPTAAAVAINGSTRMVENVTLEGRTGPLVGAAVDPEAKTIYATSFEAGTLLVAKENWSPSDQPDNVGVGRNPNGVAVDPGNAHTVYVANNGRSTVSVIDGVTHEILDRVQVGNNPSGVAVDLNNHTVYVTNEADNTVSVIDGRTSKVKATVPVGKNPDAVAIDQLTKKVYVANKGDNTVSAITS
jgi:YVTN family beta-propeller protein